MNSSFTKQSLTTNTLWDFAKEMAAAQKAVAGLSLDNPRVSTDHEANADLLSEGDVDAIAASYENAKWKAQARFGFRPFTHDHEGIF